MKLLKRLMSLVLALCMALSLMVSVHAEEPDTDATAESEFQEDERFKDKTWNEIIDDFLAEHGTDPDRIALGYVNLVTGEEQYHRGDEYMVAASMYKVPLNMVYAERISKGEMDWNTPIRGVSYTKLMRGSIIDSNNEFSDYLRKHLGTYREYRNIIAPLMGVDINNVDDMYYVNNYFTAEQMIYCLKLLYDNPDTYPKIVDTMLEAEPNNYFKYHQQDYEVAHKYGYLEVDGRLELNDCGIVFTDDPIAIVMFSLGISKPYNVMADFCTLMADYSQYTRQVRLIEEERLAAQRAEEEAKAAAERAEQAAMAAMDQAALDAEMTKLSHNLLSVFKDPTSLFILAVVLIGLVLFLILVTISAAKYKLTAGAGVATVILFALGVALSVIGPKVGCVITAPSGNPQDVVYAFFEAIQEEDYDTAYSYLDYYSSLGLENEPASEAGKLMYDALHESYNYRLFGDCVTNQLTAKQQVLLEHLDILKMQTKFEEETQNVLEDMVNDGEVLEIYDENDQFLPDVTAKAYVRAVDHLLEKPQLYRTTTSMELELVYTNDGWRIRANDALLHALCGGTAY